MNYAVSNLHCIVHTYHVKNEMKKTKQESIVHDVCINVQTTSSHCVHTCHQK